MSCLARPESGGSSSTVKLNLDGVAPPMDRVARCLDLSMEMDISGARKLDVMLKGKVCNASTVVMLS